MTWFDGIDVHHLLFDQEVKKMSACVQPPIDCCGSSSLVVLFIDEPITLTQGHVVNGPIARCKKQL
jgi:hypothetical protein